MSDSTHLGLRIRPMTKRALQRIAERRREPISGVVSCAIRELLTRELAERERDDAA